MPNTVDVQIKNMAFTPNPVPISAGDTVRWTNKDAHTHTATADGGEFDSGHLSQGASFQHTFGGPMRSVTYHCDIHPGMRATVSVT